MNSDAIKYKTCAYLGGHTSIYNIDGFFKAEEGKMVFLQSKFNENQATYFEKVWKDRVLSKFDVKITSLFTEPKDDREKAVKIFEMITDNESSDSKKTEEKRRIRKDTEEILRERIKNYWETAKEYQRVHLVVMLSRLTELGYCEKSKKRPFTYSFYN